MQNPLKSTASSHEACSTTADNPATFCRSTILSYLFHFPKDPRLLVARRPQKKDVLTKGEVSPGVQMRVSCMCCYPCECEEKDPLHAIGCRLVGVSIACSLLVWRRMSARFLRAEGNACTGCMHGPRIINIGACLLVPFCRVARTLSGQV